MNRNRRPAPAAKDDVPAVVRGPTVTDLVATAAAFLLLGLVATRALLGEAAVTARVVSTFEAGGVSPSWWLPGELAHWDTYREVDGARCVSSLSRARALRSR